MNAMGGGSTHLQRPLNASPTPAATPVTQLAHETGPQAENSRDPVHADE
jgi:hypothetical protein